MIKVGDTLTIEGYDYNQMSMTKRKFVVLAIYPFYVLGRHKKAGYRECFGIPELIENGYIPNFEDVKDEARTPRHTANYGPGNKLLIGY